MIKKRIDMMNIFKYLTFLILLAVGVAVAANANETTDSVCTEGEFGPSLRAVIDRSYEVPDTSPIWFGGQALATNACARQFCLYMDVHYADGTFAYKILTNFSEGTHGWERSERVFYPTKPVSRIKCYALFRNNDGRENYVVPPPIGTVRFRDVFLRRRDPGHVPLTDRRFTARPYADRDETLASYPTRAPQDRHRWQFLPCRENTLSLTTHLSPLGRDELCVWTADSMRKVTPLTFPTEAERAAPCAVSLALAKGERESAQLLLSTGAEKTLENVRIEFSSFSDAAGNLFDGTVKWERLGYVARRGEYAAHPFGVDSLEKWIPDPILPAAPMKLRRAGTQGVWLTAFANREATAGTYRGEARVLSGSDILKVVTVEIRVRNFALPKTHSFPAMIAMMDGFLKRFYPKDFAAKHRESIDLMLDHRLDWTDISRTSLPDIEEIAYAKSRGQRHTVLLNLVPPPKKGKDWVCFASKDAIFNESFFTYVTNTLTPYVAELRRRGLMDGCCLYGFDERCEDYYPQMDRLWKRLKTIYPDLPLITSAMMFRDRVKKGAKMDPVWTTTDWHTPSTAFYDEKVADELRSLGKQVWWYTCCGPYYPHCNFASLENPTIEGRLIPWLTHRFRADGFLFWDVDYWNADQPKLDEGDVFFEEWNTWSSLEAPGDGILIYPGKHHLLSSIRLVNLRDGSEDYDYLVLAAAKAPAKVKEIEQIVCRGTMDFTRDPSALRAARERLAKVIEH